MKRVTFVVVFFYSCPTHPLAYVEKVKSCNVIDFTFKLFNQEIQRKRAIAARHDILLNVFCNNIDVYTNMYISYR